jgi:hypothetical protein
MSQSTRGDRSNLDFDRITELIYLVNGNLPCDRLNPKQGKEKERFLYSPPANL